MYNIIYLHYILLFIIIHNNIDGISETYFWIFYNDSSQYYHYNFIEIDIYMYVPSNNKI